MTVGKALGGAWFIVLGLGLLIVIVLLFTTKVPRRVPSTFVCAPMSMAERASQATTIVSGVIDAVLPGSPYADVWVKPTHWYKGTQTKFVRFAAWPRAGTTAGIGDLHFQSGDQQYLFFFRSIDQDLLTTSSCYGTRVLTADGLSAAEQAVLQ